MIDLLPAILVISGLLALWSCAVGAFMFAPWVPADHRDFERVFALAGLKPGETFYDLGCGDGRMVFEAGERGAKAVGVELALPLFLICKARQRLLQTEGVVFRWGDLFRTDLAKADVVFLFGLPRTLRKRMTAKLGELRPGARVVSYAFALEGWTPVEVSKPDAKDLPVYLYRV